MRSAGRKQAASSPRASRKPRPVPRGWRTIAKKLIKACLIRTDIISVRKKYILKCNSCKRF